MATNESNIEVPSSSYVHPSAVLEGNVEVGDGCFVAAGAILSGQITIGDGTLIGERSVLTGDISIGDHTSILVNVVIRGTNRIGSYVCIYDMVNIEGGRPYDETGDRSIICDGAWINHGATMHGCEIGEGAAVCINAALDYHCQIGRGAIVANGSACPVGMVVPGKCIAEGVPAKVVKRDITDDDRREWLGLLPSDWVVRFAGFTPEMVRARLRAEQES
jgi:carbonic anhydrase/acetyltransferase-like protein (isoleucine patch superfamily)